MNIFYGKNSMNSKAIYDTQLQTKVYSSTFLRKNHKRIGGWWFNSTKRCNIQK